MNDNKLRHKIKKFKNCYKKFLYFFISCTRLLHEKKKIIFLNFYFKDQFSKYISKNILEIKESENIKNLVTITIFLNFFINCIGLLHEIKNSFFFISRLSYRNIKRNSENRKIRKYRTSRYYKDFLFHGVVLEK